MARRIALAVLSLVLAVAALLVGVDARPASAVPAPGTPFLPDLQSQIPSVDMGIVRPTPTTREFRYTHTIVNFGDGPLEIHTQYDPTADISSGTQFVYTKSASGTWSVASQRSLVGRLYYHAVHGHEHFPMASFGLYTVATDGSVGAPVALSPKIGFCIADSWIVDPSLPNAGTFGYTSSGCQSGTSTLGLSVGGGDFYDFHDDGQAVPIDSLPDGTYWFRSVVDPFNYLLESNEANNITDVKVRVSGDTVTTFETVHPDSTPPSVAVTAPGAGSVSGSVSLAATASDPAGVTSVQFLLDGQPLGPALTSAPYTLTWDSTATQNGPHELSAQATTTRGLHNTTAITSILVANSAPGGGPLTIQQQASATGNGAVTAAPVTVPADGLVVALVGSDGPASSAQTVSVSGGALSWVFQCRINTQHGTSEVWSAVAPTATSVAVTSTPAAGGYPQLLSVAAFPAGARPGARATASAATGAPSVSLTATAEGSWTFAAGNDWDRAQARTPAAGQVLQQQVVQSSVGDTLWVQSTTGPTGHVGQTVTINDTAPTNDRWNLAALEVVPGSGGGPPPPTGPVVANVQVLDRTSSSARVTWTTDVGATTQIEYGLTPSYGSVTTLDPALVTSHSASLSGLTPNTAYHYRIVATNGSGVTTRTVDFTFTTAAVSTITVQITAPAAGATVSGAAVSVTADAASTASVSGVQFTLDGAPLGAEDTAPPYSVSWNTTTVANGTHTLSAIAHDPTGNTATATGVGVTVQNAAPPPPSGLVGAWSFNEGAGGTAADSSGNGNRGTVTGAAWTPSGRFGSALSFTANNQIVDVADASSLDLTTGMTIEAWVYPTTNSGWRTVALKERTGGLAYGLYAGSDANRPAGYVAIGSAETGLNGTAAVPLNTWTHLATTYDGTTLRLYVNGVQVSQRAVSGAIATSTGGLRFGGNRIWGEWFRGRLDEIRIYNRALSAAEIATDRTTAI